MTAEKLKELRAAATQGEWSISSWKDPYREHINDSPIVTVAGLIVARSHPSPGLKIAGGDPNADMDFIAAAANHAVEIIEGLEGEVAVEREAAVFFRQKSADLQVLRDDLERQLREEREHGDRLVMALKELLLALGYASIDEFGRLPEVIGPNAPAVEAARASTATHAKLRSGR